MNGSPSLGARAFRSCDRTLRPFFFAIHLQEQRRIIVPISLGALGKSRGILAGNMPRNAAIHLAIAVGDEIPEAPDLSPWVIEEGEHDVIGKMDGIFSDAINGGHHRIVGQFPIIRAIIHELLPIKGETLDTGCKSPRIVSIMTLMRSRSRSAAV